MSELLDKRITFTGALADLIKFIGNAGYEVAIAPDGQKHMKNSLHYVGLAIDLCLYKDGKYLLKTEEYKFAGDFWKGLGKEFRWGGDFKSSPDGNHFSVAFGGYK